MGSDDAYSFAPAVSAYVDDLTVQTAVDALLDAKPSKIEADQWRDVTAYYDAFAGAQVVRTEWAKALHELWHRIWQELLPSDWVALSPSEQKDDWDWGVDLNALWEYSTLARGFRQRGVVRGPVIFLAVCLDFDTGVQIGLQQLSTTGKPLRSRVGGFEKGTDESLMWSAEGAVPLTSSFELTSLRRQARQALELLTTHESSDADEG